MMHHLERAAKRLCLEHARASKNRQKPAEAESCKTHAWLRDTAVIAANSVSGIARSACRDNAAIWLPHRSEPSDY